MSSGARVHDIDTIRLFRAALVKFTESSSVALTDAEGEILRKLTWLESEQDRFWQMQVRKWTEEVAKAKDAVRQKTIFKDSLGRTQSAVDEMKHLKKCQAALDTSEEKLKNTRRHARELQREHLLYRGGVQRFATILSADMPNAIAALDRIVGQLEAYTAAGPAMATSEAGSEAAGTLGAEGEGSMKRAVEDEPEPKPADERKDEVASASEPQAPNPEPRE